MNPEDRTVILYYMAILCALLILLMGNCGDQETMATTGVQYDEPAADTNTVDDVDRIDAETRALLLKLKELEKSAHSMSQESVDCATRPINVEQSAQTIDVLDLPNTDKRAWVLINSGIEFDDVPVNHP